MESLFEIFDAVLDGPGVELGDEGAPSNESELLAMDPVPFTDISHLKCL